MMESVYNTRVEALRQTEYPHMNNDSGTTIYAKSVVESFAQKMTCNLYGNPHSENLPAQLSGTVVDEVRERTLRFLGADPEHFDLVFVANATAAVKLVAEAFRDLAEKSRERRFWYGYHKDAHTSLVGVREYTQGRHHCFESDDEVAAWMGAPLLDFGNGWAPGSLGLFAYPGQSNMSGRRLPQSWPDTLFDAAALAMTSSMEPLFQDPAQAPDFTCLSLYKIFGFPDLGALIVRRQSGHILSLRKYFGGGTVTMVSTIGGQSWHRSKGLQAPTYKLHEGLEDGTLPFHSILALGEAIDVHKRLYQSMNNIAQHTSYLTRRLIRGLSQLQHGNGLPVCQLYSHLKPVSGGSANSSKQGPVAAFNVFKSDGQYVPYSVVEASANSAGIYIRSGGVCNPGGIFSALGYEPWMTERALSAGYHCGSHGIAIIHRLPTGIVRASIGAMTTRQDVDTFLDFMRDTFVEHKVVDIWADSRPETLCSSSQEGGADTDSDVPDDYTHESFPDVRELPRPNSMLAATPRHLLQSYHYAPSMVPRGFEPFMIKP